MRFCEESDEGHGRSETSRCWITPYVDWFKNASGWSCLTSFCKVEAERTLGGKSSVETRFYVTTLRGHHPRKAPKASKAHWGVKNRLHWCLDVTFGEDKADVRLRTLAENFSVIRHLAINAVRKMPASTATSPRQAGALPSIPPFACCERGGPWGGSAFATRYRSRASGS